MMNQPKPKSLADDPEHDVIISYYFRSALEVTLEFSKLISVMSDEYIRRGSFVAFTSI